MRIKTSVLNLGRYSPDRLIKLAQLQENCSYDVFWYADERFFREVYSSLTLAAVHTERIAVGTMVTDPYTRHPAITAMCIATLDEISEGRAILGIGAGVSGFAELKIDRRKPALAMREMVTVVQEMLRGETLDFEGEIIELAGGHLNFEPFRADLPIYIASYGPLGLILPGEVAQGAVMQGAVANGMVDWLVDNVRTGVTRADRTLDEVDIVARVNLCIHPDTNAAKDVMRPDLVRTLVSHYPEFRIFNIAGVEVPVELRDAVATFRDTHGYTHDPDALAPIAAMVPDSIVDAFTLAGDVDEVAMTVERMIRRGITHVMIFPMGVDSDDEAVIADFANKVMPRVRERVQANVDG